MLDKLIKYEINATGRKLVPLYIALIVFTLINKINFNKIFNFYNNNLLKIGNIIDINIDINNLIRGLLMGAYIVTIVGIIVATIFIVIERFYKNLFGNEGYLMNTIPVKASENILSKLIVGVMWYIIGFIVSIVSFAIIIYQPNIENTVMFYGNGDIYKILKFILSVKPVICIISFVMCLFTQIIFNILQIYTSISIGQLSNRHKIITSFAAYLAINLVINSITSVFSLIVYNIMNISFTISEINISFLMVMIFGIVMNIILSIPCYIITKHIIENKLNLE